MEEKDQFLRELGQRIADSRKSEGLTQAQLGETVGVSQQVVADYECGSRHIPVWRLMCVADAMGVDVTVLLGTSRQPLRKRGPTPKVRKQLEAIGALPKDKRRFVEEVLANILNGAKGAEKGGSKECCE